MKSGAHYKSNFLTNVILNIRFPSVFGFDDKSLPKFQKAIKKEFISLEEGKDFNISNTFDAKKQSLSSITEEKLSWRFFNKDRTRILKISDDNLIVEFKKYKHFPEYFDTVNNVLKAFKTIHGAFSSTRIGLRYMNQISLKGNPFTWNKYLNKHLFESMNFYKDKESLSRFINVTELAEKDYRMRIQTGIANSLYPGQIAKKEFILDYDCITDESHESDAMPKKITEFNKIITDYFEMSIKDGLRKEMQKDA